MSQEGVEKRYPAVAWAERKNLIHLTVFVTDCKKPEIKLETDKLFFKGKNGEGTTYEITLEFLKEINVDTSKYFVKDREITFVLMKSEPGPYWNRLLKENKKFHWLKIDFDKWKDEDDSDIDMNDESDFEEMMKQMSGLKSTSNDLNDLEDESDEEKE
ncbi:co-chaperone protein p23-1 [Trichonephila inaurata madagascariensis]|uniref:Co-chaperone protein p23-1 n=1 Tax=Trichonephila inaurata madagascariensis TaxID=2747483 RepID=A0A8X6XZV6_9ARAC|nr:co-chaperone protein p23-1 [Trichonephila inaurata madagascariensis]